MFFIYRNILLKSLAYTFRARQMFMAIIMYTWTRGNVRTRELAEPQISKLLVWSIFCPPGSPKWMWLCQQVWLNVLPFRGTAAYPLKSDKLRNNKSILYCPGWWDRSLALGLLRGREKLLTPSLPPFLFVAGAAFQEPLLARQLLLLLQVLQVPGQRALHAEGEQQGLVQQLHCCWGCTQV